jgi:hypothetical protein
MRHRRSTGSRCARGCGRGLHRFPASWRAIAVSRHSPCRPGASPLCQPDVLKGRIDLCCVTGRFSLRLHGVRESMDCHPVAEVSGQIKLVYQILATRRAPHRCEAVHRRYGPRLPCHRSRSCLPERGRRMRSRWCLPLSGRRLAEAPIPIEAETSTTKWKSTAGATPDATSETAVMSSLSMPSNWPVKVVIWPV